MILQSSLISLRGQGLIDLPLRTFSPSHPSTQLFHPSTHRFFAIDYPGRVLYPMTSTAF